MPFYELVCIARSKLVENNLRDLIKTTATHVMNQGGVVRGFDNLGTEKKLPHRIKRHQEYHTKGDFWVMHFHANPLMVQNLSKKLLVDSRVLRHTFIKLGDKLDTIITRPDKS
ncbi:30S ribosomal protein S6 [Syncephalastrum racemosum]|uniref:30S ribosomal protein S6 n=1 Tax=Syncephalastrum racemosum TaxID=13706 RepID=A0A1X2H6A7_SYNRA|nr:30S ribosomal protein S6 [Syncephalastrum racemosum]